jgi:hypothetical protein
MRYENVDLTHFFAWARSRAYSELEARLTADPEADPNWTFSEIMQRLLEEFRGMKGDLAETPDVMEIPEIGSEVRSDGEKA